MALTKTQFRLLLASYLLFIVLGILCAVPGHTPLTPRDVAQAKTNFGMEKLSDHDFAFIMAYVLGVSLMAWLVSLVYLFFFVRVGLYILIFAVCSRLILMRHLPPRGTTAGPQFYGWTELLLEVAILAIGFFGPAKHLFQRNREP